MQQKPITMPQHGSPTSRERVYDAGGGYVCVCVYIYIYIYIINGSTFNSKCNSWGQPGKFQSTDENILEFIIGK